MKIIRINPFEHYTLPPSVCALGYFDGLHRGHQQLIQAALTQAEKLGMESAVLSFDPDPWRVLRPQSDLFHLSDLHDKAFMLAAMGVDLFYVITFSKEFAGWSNERFHEFLAGLNIQEIVCGFDYTYGRKGSGTTEALSKAFEGHVHVIEQIQSEHAKISSSRIEALVEAGEMRKAAELLGSFYSIRGTVTHGYQRGRQLGFPTANLGFSSEEILPASGVYAGYVQSGTRFLPAMINVGRNPTFNNKKKTVEAFILDFHEDIYGKPVRFFFADRLRQEIRFASPEDLADQLERDAKATRPALEPLKDLLEATEKLWRAKPEIDEESLQALAAPAESEDADPAGQ